jgi:Tfp pilus assembly protein PilF
MDIRMLIRRDVVVYTAVFAVWALIIGLMHGNYRYFGTPFPSATINQVNDSRAQTIANDMGQIKNALAAEKDPKQRGRMQANLGAGYFELYRGSRKTTYLDSAQQCFTLAMNLDPGNADMSFNSGMVCMEKREFGLAKAHFDKAVALNPKHLLALHNLGLLSYYELKNQALAKEYFEKSLVADPAAPLEHYMLALLALDNKDPASAAANFTKEAEGYALGSGRQSALADPNAARMAATLSCFQLAVLYSTSLKNPGRAREYFNRYGKLETDPRRRQNAMQEISKYGVISSKDLPSR